MDDQGDEINDATIFALHFSFRYHYSRRLIVLRKERRKNLSEGRTLWSTRSQEKRPKNTTPESRDKFQNWIINHRNFLDLPIT